MKYFGPDTQLADVVLKNPMLLSVLNRFDITIGFGDKTIGTLCREKEIHPDLLLCLLNAYHDEDYFPEDEFMKFPVVCIADYLRKTHIHYLEYILPLIGTQLDSVLSSLSKENPANRIIRAFYEKYSLELTAHIRQEEEVVFPYIYALQKSLEEGEEMGKDRKRSYSIKRFEEEHVRVDEKLDDLKSIVIKYLDPAGNNEASQALLLLLFRFEKDLKDHARIEDKILVPMVMQMESRVRSKKSESVNLSSREKDVLREVAQGLSNKEIAGKLYISIHTVISHRKNIGIKLGIKTVAGLTVYAVLNGIISPDILPVK